jgi:SAM-dependent methyltransferase
MRYRGCRRSAPRRTFADRPERESGCVVAALIEVGVDTGWRCWEVGAGHGSIARWLAKTVGSDGVVVATDVDDRWFDADIPLVSHDVSRDPPPGASFDLIHARLLLEHLADPPSVIARLVGALGPGGMLVVEDAAGLRFAASPAAPVFDRVARAWERAGRAVGWNACYGAVLIDDLRAAGLADVQGREHRLVAPGGEAWSHVRAGVERLRHELAAQGVTAEDIDATLASLADPGILITGAPVISAWGRRPTDR